MSNPYKQRTNVPNPARDRRTLAVLIGATVLIGGAFLYSTYLASRHSVVDESAPSEDNDWGGDLEDRFPYSSIEVSDTLRSQIREETETDRVLKEKEPYDYLLGEVADRPFRFFLHEGYAYVPEELSTAAILADPGRYRARSLAFKGTLLRLEQKELELPAALAEVTEGVVRIDGDTVDGKPAYLYFEAVREPEGVQVGDVVVVFGTFYKKFDFRVEEGGKPEYPTGPFVIAREIKRSYHEMTVTEVDPAILRKARDDTETEMLVVEQEPWFHLLSYARNSDPDVARETLIDDQDMTEVYGMPSAYRGKELKFRGKLVQVLKNEMEDNPAGLDAYYVGFVKSMDGTLVQVHFVNKPVGVKAGNLVAVRGVFLKNVKYQAKNQINWPQVPLVIGVAVDPIAFRDSNLREIQIALGVTALALLSVFVVALLRGRRADHAFEAAYWEKRRARAKETDLNRAAKEAVDRAGRETPSSKAGEGAT